MKVAIQGEPKADDVRLVDCGPGVYVVTAPSGNFEGRMRVGTAVVVTAGSRMTNSRVFTAPAAGYTWRTDGMSEAVRVRPLREGERVVIEA